MHLKLFVEAFALPREQRLMISMPNAVLRHQSIMTSMLNAVLKKVERLKHPVLTQYFFSSDIIKILIISPTQYRHIMFVAGLASRCVGRSPFNGWVVLHRAALGTFVIFNIDKGEHETSFLISRV